MIALSVFKEFRTDGWPYCPQCGEDELWSDFLPEPPDYKGTLEQYLAGRLRCYLCGWDSDPITLRCFVP